MIKGLAKQVAKQANYFPVKGGVSSVLSPRQLIEQRNLDFNKDLGIPFGSYVEAAQKTTNTVIACTTSAIYILVFLPTFKVDMKSWHWIQVWNSVHRQLQNFQ